MGKICYSGWWGFNSTVRGVRPLNGVNVGLQSSPINPKSETLNPKS